MAGSGQPRVSWWPEAEDRFPISADDAADLRRDLAGRVRRIHAEELAAVDELATRTAMLGT